jgi:hypothetical protein
MTQSVLMTLVFALLVYGVERNHLRQARRQLPRRRELIGSTDVEDRDLARLSAELRALPSATDPTAPAALTRPTESRRPTASPRPTGSPRPTLPRPRAAADCSTSPARH